MIIQELKNWKLPYVVISGDYNHREKEIEKYIKNVLKYEKPVLEIEG